MTESPDWYEIPTLSGRLVHLRALAETDAPGYLAAGGGPGNIPIFANTNTPGTTGGMLVDLAGAQLDVDAALEARATGERLPFAQLDASTGAFIGTTSFYEINPALRTLSIGYTWLALAYWRTGHNVESKLLLLTHAFETLQAVRVVWHTDIRNTRSQRAIEGLGATREGELRKHRPRRDGSWRSTVQYSMIDDDWPAAREALTRRLARG